MYPNLLIFSIETSKFLGAANVIIFNPLKVCLGQLSELLCDVCKKFIF